LIEEKEALGSTNTLRKGKTGPERDLGFNQQGVEKGLARWAERPRLLGGRGREQQFPVDERVTRGEGRLREERALRRQKDYELLGSPCRQVIRETRKKGGTIFSGVWQ